MFEQPVWPDDVVKDASTDVSIDGAERIVKQVDVTLLVHGTC